MKSGQSDILKTGQSIVRTKLMVNEIRDLTEQLSDFNSCVEYSSDDADTEGDLASKPWTSMNEKKRGKRNKRKHSLTPNKDDFLKKQNLAPDTVC